MIKACPFCVYCTRCGAGRSRRDHVKDCPHVQVVFGNGNNQLVECQACGACGPEAPSEEGAVIAWNRRQP